MEPLRLDPADPLASVLAWFAEMLRALGLQAKERAPLDRATAADVRRVLADWSRQLRRVIQVQAATLAARLAMRRAANPPTLVAERASRARPTRAAAPAGRMVVVARARARATVSSKACSDTPPGGEPSADANPDAHATPARPSASDLLDPAEAAALKRRTRAVLLALHDPSVAIRRLALRLARAGRSPRRVRFGPPPRTLSVVRRGRAIAPEPRPPNGAMSRLSA